LKRSGANSGKTPIKRIFVDANTIISGLLFRGNKSLLLRLGMIRLCELVTSEFVFKEVERALRSSRFGISEDEVTFLTSYLHRCVRVRPSPSPKEISLNLARLEDKKDVHVLVAFERLGCDFLLTGDSELLSKVKCAKRTRQILELLLRDSATGWEDGGVDCQQRTPSE